MSDKRYLQLISITVLAISVWVLLSEAIKIVSGWGLVKALIFLGLALLFWWLSKEGYVDYDSDWR